jgi:predicted N-acetyltransferase YhbS
MSMIATDVSCLGDPFNVSAIAPGEHAALVAWLDDRLREGRRGRLRAEYPLTLHPRNFAAHRVARRGREVVAHAMSHVVQARTPARVTIGMIGLVFSDPAVRGRGLASQCVEACLADLASRRVPIVLLWSDKGAFYRRLGFSPVGFEVHFRIDAATCRRALDRLPERRGFRVDAARARDWQSLEQLHAAQPIRVDREAGSLRTLAGAPETRVVVARRGKQAHAYAALGRGDDFRNVVHEWAGEPAGVLRCLETLCGDGELVWLRGPLPGAVDGALQAVGAPRGQDPFALGRLLDPTFETPSSLYLWGFDSI